MEGVRTAVEEVRAAARTVRRAKVKAAGGGEQPATGAMWGAQVWQADQKAGKRGEGACAAGRGPTVGQGTVPEELMAAPAAEAAAREAERPGQLQAAAGPARGLGHVCRGEPASNRPAPLPRR